MIDHTMYIALWFELYLHIDTVQIKLNKYLLEVIEPADFLTYL